MTQVAQAKANGKSTQGVPIAPGTETKQPAASNGIPTEKEIATVSIQNEAKPEPVLTVEDKIRKIDLLNDLISKRGVLKTHLGRVEALKFGDYEEKDTIAITSGSGGTYSIKSSALCQKIAAMLKEEIGGKIVEVEAAIAF